MRIHGQDRTGPWFWAHPLTALSVACVVAALVNLVLFTIGGQHTAVASLYALPVTLVALTAGRRAGLLAGVFVAGVLAIWSVLEVDAHHGLIDWLCHVVPILLLGVLVGDATDRIRSGERTRRHAAVLEDLSRDSAEAHDAVMQRLAVAKWRIEAGEVDAGLDDLTEAMTDAQDLVSRLIGSDSVLPGNLRVSRPTVRGR